MSVATTFTKTSSFQLALQAVRETARSYTRVVLRGWMLIIPLHLVQAGAGQFFTYAADFLRETGREELAFIALIAGVELLFTLIWSAAWVIAINKLAEAEDDSQRNETKTAAPRFFELLVRYFNPLVIEQIRCLAAVLWRLPLLIVPGLVEYVRLAFVPLVVILDQRYEFGEIDALTQSRRLSGGHFWLLTVTVLFALIAPWLAEEAARGTDGPWLWINPGGVAIGWLLTLFINLATSIFLFHLFRGLSQPVNQMPLSQMGSDDVSAADLRLDKP